jgi:hypothetical protein
VTTRAQETLMNDSPHDTRIYAERIKRDVTDAFTVIRRLGLEEGSSRLARGALVRCPWHAERTTSCAVVSGPDGRVRAYCSKCQRGGDVLALVAAVQKLHPQKDLEKVVRAAADKFGMWSLLFEMDRTAASLAGGE